MTYQQQIKHPNWQKKRLEVLEAHHFECQNCGSKDEELHVHHPYYKRGAMIWQYETAELECLCHKCHKEAHALDDKIKKALAICPLKSRILGYILAVNACSIDDANVQQIPDYEASEGAVDYMFSGPDTHEAVKLLISMANGKNGEVDLWEFEEMAKKGQREAA